MAKVRKSSPKVRQEAGGRYWLVGSHSVRQALYNPDRRIFRVLVTERGPEEIIRLAERRNLQIDLVDRARLDRLVGIDNAHQHIALDVAPLEPLALSDLPDPEAGRPILILDHITDPRNVGAILRSAAVFGAVAVLVQARHAPPETSSLSKAASGALEEVPIVRVGNLVQALDGLKERGYWVAGLAGEAESPLTALPIDRPLALVVGAEGEGLRRLTRERCDMVLSIPMAPNIVGSLNVSNAAAIALYAACRSAIENGD